MAKNLDYLVKISMGHFYIFFRRFGWMKAFVNTVRIVPFWELNFCSRVLRLSVLSWGRPQIAICCLDWLGRWKCLATGLDAFLSSFLTSKRCSRNRSPSRLPVSPMHNFLQRVQAEAYHLEASKFSLYVGNNAGVFHPTNQSHGIWYCTSSSKKNRLIFLDQSKFFWYA